MLVVFVVGWGDVVLLVGFGVGLVGDLVDFGVV